MGCRMGRRHAAILAMPVTRERDEEYTWTAFFAGQGCRSAGAAKEPGPQQGGRETPSCVGRRRP